MFKLQCDKNLKKVIEKIFILKEIDAEITTFSNEACNICIIRSENDFEKNSMPKADYFIINSDDANVLKRIKGIKSKVITCGLSTRSTITLSSISDSRCVMCLQRSIFNLNGAKISPFELPFELCGIAFDEVSIVMVLTAAILCNSNVAQLDKIYF